MKKNILYARHNIAAIINAFEEFLDSKGIDIANPEKEDDEDAAIIYGEDFDYIESNLTPIIENLIIKAHEADGYNLTSYNDDEEHNILFERKHND